ncbi:hypothetical protein [Phyllobacterium salinisoli]|nr:hypothetical protein [Phyllobacterium salinisoli]
MQTWEILAVAIGVGLAIVGIVAVNSHGNACFWGSLRIAVRS